MEYLALESNISDSKFAERTCCPTCRICDLKIKREECILNIINKWKRQLKVLIASVF